MERASAHGMGEVGAYFDLDGTLLDASSEKTLTATLLRRRPWCFPVGLMSWSVRALVNLLRGRAPYDALRNRGHFTGASWSTLERLSEELVEQNLVIQKAGKKPSCNQCNYQATCKIIERGHIFKKAAHKKEL